MIETMAPFFTVEIDKAALIAALDAVPETVLAYLKPAAKITADNIAREYRARAARAAKGPTRGGQHTADQVVVEETYDGTGYIVAIDSPEMPGLPGWLEFGTECMTPHPSGGALIPSARLEEGPHDQRAREAVQNAINARGLGDA